MHVDCELLSWNKPGGQLKQLLDDVRAVFGLYLPAAHERQELCPELYSYWPAAQARQSGRPVYGWYWPAAQEAQDEERVLG
jgi:hypothetical protein